MMHGYYDLGGIEDAVFVELDYCSEFCAFHAQPTTTLYVEPDDLIVLEVAQMMCLHCWMYGTGHAGPCEMVEYAALLPSKEELIAEIEAGSIPPEVFGNAPH